MNVLVAGSRSYVNCKEEIFETLDSQYVSSWKCIISGGAIGPDSIAIQWAIERKIPYKIIKPDWKKYGKGAGIIRNTELVQMSDRAIIFWDRQSKGTLDTIRKCKSTGIPKLVFNIN